MPRDRTLSLCSALVSLKFLLVYNAVKQFAYKELINEPFQVILHTRMDAAETTEGVTKSAGVTMPFVSARKILSWKLIRKLVLKVTRFILHILQIL